MNVLKTLPDESVQCCVTSPPYWALRDYGTANWDGGKINCDHSTARSRGDDIKEGDKQGTSQGSRPNIQKICLSCGAVRIDEQIGLESTPEKYVAKLVEIFGEVKRVLKKDGTLWLNLGDTYMSAKGTGVPQQTISGKRRSDPEGFVPLNRMNQKKLKNKDLVGIPWRVALSLQNDGWWLRSDIIWNKPNPMPESVTDRPTRSHEYIFLLSKSAKYYYDGDAIRESAHDWGTRHRKLGSAFVDGTPGRTYQSGGQNCNFAKRGRNKRSVWTVTTKPYKGAHFATFPEDLITPCILAGSSEDDIILDPFFGSGTVGVVSLNNNRNYIGIELNSEYIDMANSRLIEPMHNKETMNNARKFFDIE